MAGSSSASPAACRAPSSTCRRRGGRSRVRPVRARLSWAWEAHGLVGVVILVGLVATDIALILGRHGRWLAIELRVWALAYPLYLLAVVRPITSMWRFLLLDFPLAAVVASVAMRTSTGAKVVAHWRRRVGVVALVLIVGLFWFTCTLLTYTPWASAPRDHRALDRGAERVAAAAVCAALLGGCAATGPAGERTARTSLAVPSTSPVTSSPVTSPSSPVTPPSGAVTTSWGGQGVASFPAGEPFDYQIGGAFAAADAVRVVSRDRAAQPDPDRYTVCYVNAYQAQPDELDWWQAQHPELLLRDAGGRLVVDEDWDQALLVLRTTGGSLGPGGCRRRLGQGLRR